jgi:hypothetical protein
MVLRRVGLVSALAVSFLCVTALGDGLRSIGVRVILPIGQMPFLLGAEVTTDISFGLVTGSFFLTSDGKALITGSCDVRLAATGRVGGTFLRLTAGLYYFDFSASLPSILLGGGLAVEVPASPALAIGASGEFLYPLAFPLPVVSASGRQLLP